MKPLFYPPTPPRPPAHSGAPSSGGEKVAHLDVPALQLRNTWNDGYRYGERIGFVSGWRIGAATGACVTLLLAAGAVAAAKSLGWL
jgi:hypothetical protein